jgi:hypothetical protein
MKKADKKGKEKKVKHKDKGKEADKHETPTPLPIANKRHTNIGTDKPIEILASVSPGDFVLTLSVDSDDKDWVSMFEGYTFNGQKFKVTKCRWESMVSGKARNEGKGEEGGKEREEKDKERRGHKTEENRKERMAEARFSF